MNREIIFRGKGIEDGRWYYGHLIRTGKDWAIRFVETSLNHGHHIYVVDPETVGQSLEKADSNHNSIFEGDIVSVNGKGNYTVYWDKENCGFSLIDSKGDGDKYGVYTRNIGIREPKKIIGNIYENPDLLTPANH